jgi:hypothetical protein
MYLQLRRASVRAGLPVNDATTPLVLLDRIRRERRSAAAPSARVVDLYLRARYGGEELRDSDLREMRKALGLARRTLKLRTS